MEHADGPFRWLEHSALGLLIRDSVLLYPLANVAHVVAVLVFFGAVAIMDARLLGLLRGEPAGAVIARWRPVAVLALAALALSGAILFIPEAGALAGNAAFRLKAMLVLIGLANVGLADLALRRAGTEHVPAPARLAALASLFLWLAVAAAGRFVAYA